MSNKDEKEKEYGETLNLPKTDFPMRGNLPKNEPGILEFWDSIDIYDKIQKKNAGHEKFVLHDGPPYANGEIHLGHTMNKVLKDIIVKSKSIQGYDAPYVPGWDTHGCRSSSKPSKTPALMPRAKTSSVSAMPAPTTP